MRFEKYNYPTGLLEKLPLEPEARPQSGFFAWLLALIFLALLLTPSMTLAWGAQTQECTLSQINPRATAQLPAPPADALYISHSHAAADLIAVITERATDALPIAAALYDGRKLFARLFHATLGGMHERFFTASSGEALRIALRQAQGLDHTPQLSTVSSSMGQDPTLIAIVNTELSDGRPVTVDFSNFPFLREGVRAPVKDTPMAPSHSTVILGREEVGDDCVYRVRNFIDPTCNLIDPAVDCSPAELAVTREILFDSVNAVTRLSAF